MDSPKERKEKRIRVKAGQRKISESHVMIDNTEVKGDGWGECSLLLPISAFISPHVSGVETGTAG